MAYFFKVGKVASDPSPTYNGQRMPHIHEKFDYTVTAYIVHEGRVLLILHKALKLWLPVGGHIELDEDPITALFREIKEECGLEVKLLHETPSTNDPRVVDLPVPAFLDHHAITDTHRHINFVYFARAASPKHVWNKDEHDDIRWFTETELDDPAFHMNPATKLYAKRALEQAGLS
jgi:8-oxo-dGTP pyrophosphatase MutT (NUDIX family)